MAESVWILSSLSAEHIVFCIQMGPIHFPAPHSTLLSPPSDFCGPCSPSGLVK